MAGDELLDTGSQIRNIDIANVQCFKLADIETKSRAHDLQASNSHDPIMNISMDSKAFAASVRVADKVNERHMTDVYFFICRSSQDDSG
jgi:hypothetical protein